MTASSFAQGLEGIIAAQSGICYVDGQAGRLVYRGYDVSDLGNWSNFEEVTYLIWFGQLPSQAQLDEFSSQLAAVRQLPGEIIDLLRALPKNANNMDILRTAVSALGLYDPEANDPSRQANVRKAMRLTSQIASLVTAYHHIQNDRDPIEPDAKLSHAANFLYMMDGKSPRADTAHVFDVALILHADHELNASTFSARVTAATLTDMYSAMAAAVGTLKGPLHGGANEAVMKMLIEVDRPERIAPFIKGELDAKRRIAGFGHRVYRTWDPRAIILRDLMCELENTNENPKWCTLSRLVSETVWNEKQLYPNVDFYSAPLYYTLGIPIDLYTPVFAVSRIAGWAGHVLEQYANNRLIRPRAEYTGSLDAQYVPIEQRGTPGAGASSAG